ncbi:hypothetical protein IWW34DRAFT_289846 [Fusarium oxysporum f. sp. albedinis]|nr:hypothetical protein IWW34DRAFT_289846 [Fusarium oxysporum f. sp. albedinis]KAK2478717.1 hypothetical protein H9L39_08091 [Fusarium oxysporum f. sp. albedinis]
MQKTTKSTRNGKPKVRTGCITCKIRRVKCDELWPACHRCTSTGRKCDGYVSAPTPVGLTAPPRFGRLTSKEARAQEFFYHETVPQLSGFFGRPFWDTVLQFSLTEASMRNASVALATLHEQHSTNMSLTTTEKDRLKFAIQSYNRAINMILKNASDPTSIPLVAVASIVFTCFECLWGDSKAAAAHVASGIGLLKMLRNKSGQPSGSWGQHYRNFELAFVEKNVAPVLCTLSLCVAEFGYPTEIYLNALDVNGCPVFDQPFRELSQARVGIIDIITGAMRTGQDGSPNSQLGKAAQLRAALELWKMRFDDLVLRQERSWDHQKLTAANLVRVMWQATAVGLSVGPSADETAWDAHREAYEEIIRLVGSLIVRSEDTLGLPRFHFEMGLISPLHLVAWKCRWPDLRRKGLALLRASSRRECLYDSKLYYAVLSRIMAIEEGHLIRKIGQQSVEYDLPPEQARIHHFVCEALSSAEDNIYRLRLFLRPRWPNPECRLQTEHICLDSVLAQEDGVSLPAAPTMEKPPVVNLFRTGPVPTIPETNALETAV